MRNTTEIQRELIRLGFLAQGGDDGIFGQASLDAYNHFLASKGKPPHTGMLLLAELNAELFPDEQAVVKPRSNVLQDWLIGLAIKQVATYLKGLPNMNFLSGYKTLGVGIGMLLIGLFNLIGWQIPETGDHSAGYWLAGGLAAIFMRLGINSAISAAITKLVAGLGK